MKRGRSLRISIALLLVTFISTVQAQVPSILPSHIPVDAVDFKMDALNNIYFVTHDNDILKYALDGSLLFRYSDNTHGPLGHLDVRNPMNILVYYPEYQTVTTLDRTLNKTGQFDLYGIDFIDIGAIGMSNDNNIWVWDNVQGKLSKVNQQGKVINSSQDMRLLLGDNLSAVYLIERENQVFISISERGVLQFDIFGQYEKEIPLKGIGEFSIEGGEIQFRDRKGVTVYNLKSLLSVHYPFPWDSSESPKKVLLNSRWFVLKEDGLYIYPIQ